MCWAMDPLDAAMDGVLDLHEQWLAQGRAEGFAAGASRGSLEGRALGRTKGRELAAEVGYMRGACAAVTRALELGQIRERSAARVQATVRQLEAACAAIDWRDPSVDAFSDALEAARTKYRQLCAQTGMGTGAEEATGDGLDY